MMKQQTQFMLRWAFAALTIFVLSKTSLVQGSAAEPASAFSEGRHYVSLTNDVKENDVVENFKKENHDKVQVIEFFSYGCSWCYKLEPFVTQWAEKTPAHVRFERVPVEFQPSWRTLTKAFYTAQTLDKFQEIHEPLFKAIHTDALTNSSEETLKAFFVDQGISAEDFDETFDSFTVNRKQKWASALSQAYRITAIPTILVQGPEGAYLTSVRMAGGENALLQVVDYLINKEYQAITNLQGS